MKITTILLAAIALPLFAAPPEITNVRAEQREGTKLIDLWYDVADEDGDLLKVRIEVSDNDGIRYAVPAFTFSGDIGDNISPGTNKHIVWDAGVDWDGEYSDQMRIKVFAVDTNGFPGLEFGNEVPPGGFLLGQDGGAEGSGPARHVNIPWSYWLSKYEITVGQYCEFLNMAYVAGLIRRDNNKVYSTTATNLINGLTGEFLLCYIGNNEKIRWNVNKFEVVGDNINYAIGVSLYGALAWANFYGYDIPTYAEWEKCARGPDFDDQGEHCCYTWGNDKDSNKGDFGNNSIYYAGKNVGRFSPNGYGCYDMTGNVGEWVRTTYGSSGSSSGSLDIENYPQIENLNNELHSYNQFANRRWIGRGFGSDFLYAYMGISTGYSGTGSGFRVCKRYIPESGD